MDPTAPRAGATFPEWPALIAIAMWASLAAIAGGTLERISPAPLLAVSLASASVALGIVELARGRSFAALLRPRPRDLLLVVYGLGGYHALLFVAFARAPLVEANLLNYLWPLLTVLLATPMCGERLRAGGIAGALLGLAGTALVIGGGASFAAPGREAGYACAIAAAVCWASFSNGLKARPLASPALPLGAALSALAAAIWVLAEGSPLPAGRALASALYLGALPMGAATAVWEVGIRRGRVAVVGALAYLTPLLSTLAVCLIAGRPLTAAAAAGGAAILAGAIVGTFRRESRRGVAANGG